MAASLVEVGPAPLANARGVRHSCHPRFGIRSDARVTGHVRQRFRPSINHAIAQLLLQRDLLDGEGEKPAVEVELLATRSNLLAEKDATPLTAGRSRLDQALRAVKLVTWAYPQELQNTGGTVDMTTSRSAAFIVLSFIAFMVSATPFVLTIYAWLRGNSALSEASRTLAQVLGPVTAVGAVIVAVYVAYQTWLAPFQPRFEARPYVWRAGPGTIGGFEIVFFFTIFNEGALPDTISDFLLEITVPNGKLILEPRFYFKPTEYYQTYYKPEIKTPFDSSMIEGPFVPLFLPGRSQISKAVGFVRGSGEHDFDQKLVVAGKHTVTLYVRYGTRGELTKVSKQDIIFDDDVLASWKAGKTVANEVVHRDTDVKNLPRR